MQTELPKIGEHVKLELEARYAGRVQQPDELIAIEGQVVRHYGDAISVRLSTGHDFYVTASEFDQRNGLIIPKRKLTIVDGYL